MDGRKLKWTLGSTRDSVPASRNLAYPWSNDTGSGLIELALVMPVFLLIIFGFINFMMVMFGACNITYAARAASRYGCMHSSTSMAPATTTDFTNIINPLLYSYPSNTQAISVTYSGGSANAVGSVISVAVTVTYNIVLPGYTYNALPIRAKSSCTLVQ